MTIKKCLHYDYVSNVSKLGTINYLILIIVGKCKLWNLSTGAMLRVSTWNTSHSF